MSGFSDLDEQGRKQNIYGYSQPCRYRPEQQIHLVAEFYANRIRPERIAYRTGIDLAFVEQLISGEIRAEHFNRLVQFYKRRRKSARFKDSLQLPSGTQRIEVQKQIDAEYQLDILNRRTH